MYFLFWYRFTTTIWFYIDKLLFIVVFHQLVFLHLLFSNTLMITYYTECPKISLKSVLHLFKYTANLYLTRCSTDLR